MGLRLAGTLFSAEGHQHKGADLDEPKVDHADLANLAAEQHHKVLSRQPYLVGGSGLPGWFAHGAASVALVADELHCIPIYSDRSKAWHTVQLRVNSAAAAGKVVRVGLYNVDADLKPTTRVADWGTVLVDSLGLKNIVVTFTVNEGWYAIAYISDGAPTLNGLDTAQAISPPCSGYPDGADPHGQFVVWAATGQTGVATGGLPDPAPSALTPNKSAAFAAVFLKRTS
jgi:hypothetical protein